MFTLHNNSANVSEAQVHVMSYNNAKQTDLALSISTLFHTCERCSEAGRRVSSLFSFSSHNLKTQHSRLIRDSKVLLGLNVCVCPVIDF